MVSTRGPALHRARLAGDHEGLQRADEIRVPVSPWLPFGAAEGTDQPR